VPRLDPVILHESGCALGITHLLMMLSICNKWLQDIVLLLARKDGMYHCPSALLLNMILSLASTTFAGQFIPRRPSCGIFEQNVYEYSFVALVFFSRNVHRTKQHIENVSQCSSDRQVDCCGVRVIFVFAASQ